MVDKFDNGLHSIQDKAQDAINAGRELILDLRAITEVESISGGQIANDEEALDSEASVRSKILLAEIESKLLKRTKLEEVLEEIEDTILQIDSSEEATGPGKA